MLSSRRRAQYLLMQVLRSAAEIGMDADLEDLVLQFMTLFRMNDGDRREVERHLSGSMDLNFTPEEEVIFNRKEHEHRDHRLYRELLAQALEDGKITEREKRLLDRMKEVLHIPGVQRKTTVLAPREDDKKQAQDIIDRLSDRFGG